MELKRRSTSEAPLISPGTERRSAQQWLSILGRVQESVFYLRPMNELASPSSLLSMLCLA